MSEEIERIEKNAILIAGAIYGGVEAGSEQYEKCRKAAHLVTVRNAAATEPMRVGFPGAAQAAETRAKQFNARYPIGTDGFVYSSGAEEGKILVRVDGIAMVYPHPFNGETVMVWLYPVGWRPITHFEPKHKAPNQDAQELCAAAAKLKSEHRNRMAEHLYYAALRADPTYWSAMNDLGVLCHQDGRYDEAVAHFTCALSYEPKAYEIYNNRSLAMRARGDYEQALLDCEESLRLTPSIELMALNRAMILDDLGRVDEAIDYLTDHITRRPDKVNVAHNRAICLLNNARFEEGWKAYESRLLIPGANVHYEHFGIPRWTPGDPVAGKNILVWTEQGVGEEVLTASMIPDLLLRGARVTLLCSEKMHGVFHRAFDGVATVARRPSQLHVDMFRREKLPPEHIPAVVAQTNFDYQMSQGDLGMLLRPTLDSFHGEPFLKTDTSDVDYQRRALEATGPLVGISWHSKRNPNIGTLKSIDLSLWGPILQTPGVRFVSLQYGDCKADIAAIKEQFGVDVISPAADPLSDMTDYVALVAAMDLVITVSNTTAHIAGGLGVPTWVMTPDGPGRLWYFFRNSAQMPWYKSLRLFRQRRSSQWGAVIAEVQLALSEWLGNRTSETAS